MDTLFCDVFISLKNTTIIIMSIYRSFDSGFAVLTDIFVSDLVITFLVFSPASSVVSCPIFGERRRSR